MRPSIVYTDDFRRSVVQEVVAGKMDRAYACPARVRHKRVDDRQEMDGQIRIRAFA